MVAYTLAEVRVEVRAARGEDPLPEPGMAGFGELGRQCVGQHDSAGATGQISGVQRSHALEVRGERSPSGIGRDGPSIAAAFSAAHSDLSARDVDILYAKPEGLGET